MKPGYDAGLYHIPFQIWIRDYKIIFGMFNIHERFAHHSIYSYIGSILWFENTINLLNYLQGTFILIFVLFLRDLLNYNKLINFCIVLSTLLSLPIWIRYFDLGYGLVDVPFGLFFYITFIMGFIILSCNKSYNENIKLNFFYFYLLVIFLTFIKPSGILILPYFFYISFLLLRNKSINNKIFINFSIFFGLIFLLWSIKNLITFGCLIYGLKFSCFNFQWSNLDLIEQSLQDVSLYKRHFALINFNNFYLYIKKNLIYIFLIIFYINILYFFLKKNFFRKNFILHSFIIALLVINLITYEFSSLKGFTTLSTDFPAISKNIIFSEALKLSIILFNSSIITFLLIYDLNKKFYFKLNLNKIFIIFYILFVLFIWFYKAPDPRFAFGFFAVIPPILVFIFINKNFYNIEIDKIKFRFLNALFYFLLLIYFIFPTLVVFNDIRFKLNEIKPIDYIKRDGYGVKPNSLIPHQTNFCWTLSDCYFHDNDIIINDFYLNYKFVNNKLLFK